MVQVRSGLNSRQIAAAVVLAAGGWALTGADALADARSESVTSRIRPDYEPLGLPMDLLFWEAGRLFSPDDTRPTEGQSALGSFIIYPSMNLALEWSDNVFRENTGENADFLFTVTPLIRLESDWDNHFLALEGGLEYGKYFEQSGNDYLDALAGLDLRIDVTEEFSIDGRAEWRSEHEGRGDVDDPGAAFDITEFRRYGGRVGATYSTEVVTVSPGYEYFQFDYDDANSPGGAINNDDRDRVEQEVFVTISAPIQEGLSAFIEPSYNWIKYDTTPDDDGFNRDSNGYAVVAGIEWDPDDVWELRAGIGYQSQDYDDARFSSISGVTFGGNVLFNADEMTTIEFGYDRGIDQTTQTGSAGITYDEFALTVDRELMPNWIVGAEGVYRHDDFSGIGRDDDYYVAGLSTDYYLGENVVIGAEYSHERRDSSVAAGSYTANSVLLNLLLRM